MFVPVAHINSERIGVAFFGAGINIRDWNDEAFYYVREAA
jgi:hypothetical protein